MRRNPFVSFLLFPLFVLLLAGCADERLPAGKTVKLVAWGFTFGEETKGLEAQVKAFEKQHPHVTVSILSMGAGTMNPQKLMTAIVGNVPPDIIRQDRFTIGDWASREAFVPLDDYIRRDRDARFGIRQEDYYKPCWDEATYQGRVFAIPADTDDRALYYNRELFREAGLDPDKPPRTWDELKEFAKKLTRYAPDGSYERIGFIPNYGNSWLYLYSWQNGGEFLSPDGRTCTMNNPYSVEALQFMVEMYDMLGGVTKVDAFASGFETNDLDPFLTGKVGMKVDGDWILNNIARFGPDLDFGVAPAPVPRERLEALAVDGRRMTDDGKRKTENGNQQTESEVRAGTKSVIRQPSSVNVDTDPKSKIQNPKSRFLGEPPFITWSGGFSYAIPVGAKNKELAWEFTKWMCSPEAALIHAEAQKEYNRSKGRPFVPRFAANIKVNEAVFSQYPAPDEKFRKAQKVFIDLLPQAKFRPVTFVGQRLWDEHARAFEQATHHKETGKSPKEVMDEGTRVVQVELDKTFRRGDYPLLDARIPLALAGLVGLMLLGGIAYGIARIRRLGEITRREAWAGYLFASPWIIGFIGLTAGPILVSVFLSFCDYDVLHPPRYVGVRNYVELFGVDRYYLSKTLGNAMYLAVYGIPLGIFTGLSVALLLNAKVTGMSGYRTVFYLPAIVPVVASTVLWAWVLNGDANRGLVNAIWKATILPMTGWDPPGWFGAADWARPGLILQGLWGAGGGMILWLAGLQGIPQQLYEAAEIDGAGIWSKFRNVTIPMLTPYIFFNLVMGTIQTLQEFDRVYILGRQAAGGSTVGPVDSLLVPVMFLFNNGFRYFKMGYASAFAWILFLVILALALLQLKLSPRWVHYEAERK